MILASSQLTKFASAPQGRNLFIRSHAYRSDAAGERHLDTLLGQLGLPAGAVALPWPAQVGGATERAVANITAWTAYLPQDCVTSMVRDGWHWST